MYTFKGRAKELTLDRSNKDNKYQAIFDYYSINKCEASKCEHGSAFDDETHNLELLSLDERFIIQNDNKELFDFISQHASEFLDISYENQKSNKDSETKNNKVIKKVVLHYE